MARTLIPLLLAAMAVVCVVGIWRLLLALGRAHAGDPALPPALAALEERVKQLCSGLAAVQPGGTP